MIRGDVFLGNEGFLVEAEKRNAHYLTKLRLTANVKKFITKLFNEADWVNATHGFEGAESALKLTGWSKALRVVVLRRALSGDVAVSIKEGPCQLPLFFLETPGSTKLYEYAVLVTSLPVEILSIAQLYRDRADSANCFDELKNQWGGVVIQRKISYDAALSVVLWRWCITGGAFSSALLVLKNISKPSLPGHCCCMELPNKPPMPGRPQ